mmetsp:Transcript_37871/g.75473  ORF Transcript_37871/g.75473 Transcript_37871/m.75473 type:complete len:244 (+) Transcript_37871:486-1217(+)
MAVGRWAHRLASHVMRRHGLGAHLAGGVAHAHGVGCVATHVSRDRAASHPAEHLARCAGTGGVHKPPAERRRREATVERRLLRRCGGFADDSALREAPPLAEGGASGGDGPIVRRQHHGPEDQALEAVGAMQAHRVRGGAEPEVGQPLLAALPDHEEKSAAAHAPVGRDGAAVLARHGLPAGELDLEAGGERGRRGLPACRRTAPTHGKGLEHARVRVLRHRRRLLDKGAPCGSRHIAVEVLE